MVSTSSSLLTIDQENKRHVFKGTGRFDMEWITKALALFQQYQVVIRHLTFHPDFRHFDPNKPSECNQCLSIGFDAPKQDPTTFFRTFSKHLDLIPWT